MPPYLISMSGEARNSSKCMPGDRKARYLSVSLKSSETASGNVLHFHGELNTAACSVNLIALLKEILEHAILIGSPIVRWQPINRPSTCSASCYPQPWPLRGTPGGDEFTGGYSVLKRRCPWLVGNYIVDQYEGLCDEDCTSADHTFVA